jgi:formylglycine-generating enzyme required for sulfatase activity
VPPPAAPPPPAPTAPVAEPPAPPAEPAPEKPAPAAAAPAGPPACPADMALVDGDYCTELELTCKKSTYAKQNKKIICHEFASPTKCVGQKVHRRYCIDKYEYANKAGEKPVVMNDFPHAQKLCAAQGKRVCTETEWTQACEGPEYKPYPYGYARDPNKCRGDRPYRHPKKQANGMLVTHSKNRAKAEAELERLYDAVPSGSQPECVSDYGVHDMPGNADELAASERTNKTYARMKMPDGHEEALRSADLYDNVTTGGPWLDGVRNQCRPKIYTHNEGFSYYYLSFRCCAEPDGKPTDPRSPGQIHRGEKWRE